MAAKEEQKAHEKSDDENKTEDNQQQKSKDKKTKERGNENENLNFDENYRIGMVEWFAIQLFKPKYDGDITDRLHFHYTPIIIVFLLCAVKIIFILNDKIMCWAPPHFSDYQVQYTNEYCWVRNTYVLPFDEDISHEYQSDKREYIPYYQWISFILMIQALLFYLPYHFHKALSRRSGMVVDDFIEKTTCLQAPPDPVTQIVLDAWKDKGVVIKCYRKAALRKLTTIFKRFVIGQRRHANQYFTLSARNILGTVCCLCGKAPYLFTTYMVMKCIFLVNVIFQLFLMNHFLGMSHPVFVLELIQRYLDDEDWTVTGLFPRVTMCDFKVRRVGNIHRYTVQCLLPLNLWNEKIYIFLYLWMMILAALTIISICYWVYKAGADRARNRYISNLILVCHSEEDKVLKQKEAIAEFTTHWLQTDAVFLLMLVGLNVDGVSERDLVLEIWRRYAMGKYKPIEEKPELWMLCRPEIDKDDAKASITMNGKVNSL